MRLLALDLALKTGWAWGDNLSQAHAGTWTLPGYSDDKIDRTLGGIYSAVFHVVRANQIEGALIEAALRTIKKQNNRGIWTPTSAHGDRCLTMLNGAARAAVSNAGAKILECPAPNTWRASVLGIAYPKEPKAAAIEYCRRNGLGITDHDAAEAACILQHGLGKQTLLDRIKT